MTVRNAGRKVKSLEYAVEHLKLEIEELTEEVQDYAADFSSELYKHVAGDAAPVTQHVSSSTIANEFVELAARPVLPDELKKLWKKIAAVTHPDKTGNNPRLTGLYRRAAEAVKSSAAQELVQIAVQLGIESPSLTRDTTLSVLNQLKQSLTDKIVDLENSVLLRWGRAIDPNEKQVILDFYIEAKGYVRK